MASEIEEIPLQKRRLKEHIGEQCPIFRIPPLLLRKNPKEFKPEALSIGPYQSENKSLHIIQQQKKRYVDFFVAAANSKGGSLSLTSLETVVGNMEQIIRNSYSHELNLKREELVKMMIEDGCFILMLVLSVSGFVETVEPNDSILKLRWIMPCLRRDLLLLENQVPFTLLEALFAQLNLGPHIKLKKLVCMFFKYSFDHMTTEVLDWAHTCQQPQHILHLIRNSFIPSSFRDTSESSRLTSQMSSCTKPTTKFLLSSKTLKLQGIKFKPKINADSIMDVGFENHTLTIPTLIMDGFKGTFFSNCLAFEQCGEELGHHITSYVIFMGCLLRDNEDASLMSREKIIENWVGTNEEASNFFKNISEGVAFDLSRSYLAPVFEGINAYTSKRTYCGSLSTVASYVAWVILLLVSIGSLVVAILAYKNHLKRN